MTTAVFFQTRQLNMATENSVVSCLLWRAAVFSNEKRKISPPGVHAANCSRLGPVK
jgi:hypothetical protein